jgi:hypothetical protein
VNPTRRPPSEWVRTVREDLRIISEELWTAAHARLHQARVTLATAIGQRALVRRDYESKYLLTEFVRCATCGGSITVVSRQHGAERAYFYGCLTNWKRGAICRNDLVLPIDRVNDAVLKALAGDVLRPAVVSAIIDGFLAAILPADVETRVEALQCDLRALDTKIANWRGLLTGSVVDGRQLLREVLEAPLRFVRDGPTYRFTAPVAVGQIIAGRCRRFLFPGVRIAAPEAAPMAILRTRQATIENTVLDYLLEERSEQKRSYKDVRDVFPRFAVEMGFETLPSGRGEPPAWCDAALQPPPA